MKRLTISTLLSGVLFLTSCNDFLNQEPLDQLSPNEYLTTESNIAAFATDQYQVLPTHGTYGYGTFEIDNNTDNMAGMQPNVMYAPGYWKVGQEGGSWYFADIYRCNYFFENVLPSYENNAIVGNTTNIKHYIGEMYFFRAFMYFERLKSLGDFPIITKTYPNEREALIEISKRAPRNEVARFILSDLDKAIEMMQNIAPSGGKNRLSKDCAILLKSRVALYEGSWLKNFKGTAFVPGGKGWPGNPADVSGFNSDAEVAYFLDEAMKSSKVVGDYIVGKLADNTDTPEGRNASLVSINPYYTMFCDENMEGYDEILMWKQFKEGLVTSNLQMELARNGGGSGWTRGMVNSFLMRNGLPIYAAGSDYNPDWEKEGVNSTLQNRDSRIVIFTKKPGDANTENKGDVNYYGDDGTPSYCSIRFIYGDKGSLATTGFIIKKGKHYSSHMANDHSAGTSGGIVFRAAEAMLIYMEASYEKNGRIDGTADGYWKALRRRAKVDEDYNKTIAATQMSEEAKGDFGAYSHGQLIDATLYNIRRERRNELCAEALRWEDLKRWRACDQLISKPYRVEGMLYWGSNYETQLADLCKVDPAEGNMSSPDLSKYILPYEKITKNNLIAGQKGFLFTPAHYLNPIGMAVFRQTASDKNDFTSSVVYQNPGWKIEGDTGAQPVE